MLKPTRKIRATMPRVPVRNRRCYDERSSGRCSQSRSDGQRDRHGHPQKQPRAATHSRRRARVLSRSASVVVQVIRRRVARRGAQRLARDDPERFLVQVGTRVDVEVLVGAETVERGL